MDVPLFVNFDNLGDSLRRRDLKPPLKYEQQLEKLKARNLIVQDENFALNKLKECNYYRLSAYTLHLKQDDVFLPGTTFEQIARLYDFDSQLRNMLIPILERIEIAFRTHIAYLLANKCQDPLSYRDQNNFTNEAFHSKLLKDVDIEIDRSKEIFAMHHKENYDGQFPIWVAVELMSFGNLSKLFGIMKREDQRQIAKEHYSISAIYAKSWRNQKIFAAILITKRLTKDHAAWRSFLGSLVGLVETYDDVIELDLIGFPVNWYDMLQSK